MNTQPESETAELPFRDSSLPIAERVADLCGRLTLKEECLELLHKAPGVERIGLPSCTWWGECLHGVSSAGVATVFPQAIGLAAYANDQYGPNTPEHYAVLDLRIEGITQADREKLDRALEEVYSTKDRECLKGASNAGYHYMGSAKIPGQILTDGQHRISFDDVIAAMNSTGRDLPSLYRETARGGLATQWKHGPNTTMPPLPSPWFSPSQSPVKTVTVVTRPTEATASPDTPKTAHFRHV